MPDRPLRRADLARDPIEQFARWFQEAEASGQPEPEAMALATATSDARVSVRFVLLRGLDERGFVFYTNRSSRKGAEIEANPWAALAFRWQAVDRQIRVNGPIAPVADAESDAYFAGRPRGSQIGAWASEQSRVAGSRELIDGRLAEFTARFEGGPVPRPAWWGGYRLAPLEVEFWQQGTFRLHDRFRYRQDPDGSWQIERLFP